VSATPPPTGFNSQAGHSTLHSTALLLVQPYSTYVHVLQHHSSRFFCILAIFRKKIHVWTLKNFNCIFGPFARRHRLWRRGTAALAQPGRRGVDVAPSSAPQILAPSSVVLSTVLLQRDSINLSSSVGGAQGFEPWGWGFDPYNSHRFFLSFK
jgi:hypothetical protein